MSIDGVGASIASALLAFYDPDNCGVLDFHVWHGLFNNDKKIFTEQDCLKYFKKLRKLARQVGLSYRDVEKAIFKEEVVDGIGDVLYSSCQGKNEQKS